MKLWNDWLVGCVLRLLNRRSSFNAKFCFIDMTWIYMICKQIVFRWQFWNNLSLYAEIWIQLLLSCTNSSIRIQLNCPKQYHPTLIIPFNINGFKSMIKQLHLIYCWYIYIYIYIRENFFRWQKLLGNARSGSTALSYRNCVITLVGGWWG